MLLRRNQKGALLLEMIIVITILGIILTFSLPSLRAFASNLKLSNVAKTLSSDLRYAQQLTVSEQNKYYVQIFEEEKKHQIIKLNTMTVVKQHILPEEVDFQEITGFTDDKIIFNFYGAVLESGVITIVNNQTNKTAIIDVKPSGYVAYSI